MSSDKAQKFLTKTVSFGGKEVTLFSLDGNTWSTRREELAEIIERHESGRVSFADKKGPMRRAAPTPVAASSPIDEDEDVPAFEDDEAPAEEILDEVAEVVDEDIDADEDAPPSKVTKGKPSPPAHKPISPTTEKKLIKKVEPKSTTPPK